MATINLFHTLTRHRLNSATLISALVEAGRCERARHSPEDVKERRHRHEHDGSDHLWPADIGITLCPANRWLIQMLQEEMASDDPARWQRAMSLEQDQQRLLAGLRPTWLALEDAPSITPDTLFVTSGDDCHLINLAGFVRNVPGGGPDRRRVTSLIVAFDSARFEWIRTLSRFYRLDPIPMRHVDQCPTE
jgi:hypothetical protein